MNTITEETVDMKSVTAMALDLSPHKQAVLLARLHENLESMGRDAEHESAWAAEIERRIREVENGEVELIDHEVVMKKAREWIARK